MLPWLVEDKLRILIILFEFKPLIISGINLSFDQSPPPITFPALALTILTNFNFF